MSSPAASSAMRAEAVVDLAAVRANVRWLLALARRENPQAELMAVVKADGYGHGAGPVAKAALAAGASALGLATPDEAVALRPVVGPGVPLVAWLWVPNQDIRPAIDAGVQLVVSSADHLDAVRAAQRAHPAADPIAIHLKVDTGLGRGGAIGLDFDRLVTASAAAERADEVSVVGVMSHLACADVAGDPSVPAQGAQFRRALRVVGDAGLTPRRRHLANTPGLLQWPDTVFDLVRCGIGLYGLDPVWTNPDIPGPVSNRS